MDTQTNRPRFSKARIIPAVITTVQEECPLPTGIRRSGAGWIPAPCRKFEKEETFSGKTDVARLTSTTSLFGYKNAPREGKDDLYQTSSPTMKSIFQLDLLAPRLFRLLLLTGMSSIAVAHAQSPRPGSVDETFDAQLASTI